MRSYSLHRLTDSTIIYQLFNYMLNITKQTSELNPLIAKFILQFDYRPEENKAEVNRVDGTSSNSYNSLIQLSVSVNCGLNREETNDDNYLSGHPGSGRVFL